jgi:hypothetical protein
VASDGCKPNTPEDYQLCISWKKGEICLFCFSVVFYLGIQLEMVGRAFDLHHFGCTSDVSVADCTGVDENMQLLLQSYLDEHSRVVVLLTHSSISITAGLLYLLGFSHGMD